MGIDTECDLAVEAREDGHIKKVIAGFRNRLLGQHLGVPEEMVSRTFESEGSLIKTIEKLQGNERTLVPLEREAPKWLDKIMPGSSLIDPERPIKADRLVQILLPKEDLKKSYINFLGIFLIILLVVALAGMWRWTALGEWFSMQNILHEANQLKGNALMPIFVYLFYLIGGLTFFPVMVMILATALFFEPLRGFFYSLTGCLLSASFSYFLGRTMGRNIVRRLSGASVNKLSERLGKNGLTALLALRIVPIAPFTAVNIVAGASHIRFGSYLLTTFLGLFPGIFAITILGHGLETLIHDPSPGGFAFLGGWAVLTIIIFVGMRKWLSKYSNGADKNRSDGKPKHGS
jgi:uncharacterized membrane protein YdjX (TVP38/TMEM64 family)